MNESSPAREKSIRTSAQISSATDRLKGKIQGKARKAESEEEDFFDENISTGKVSNNSCNSDEGRYCSEQALHNNLDSSLSLIERSAKLQK
jgi:hypothetical protein